jgi:capsular polysaccharide transport system permease protein
VIRVPPALVLAFVLPSRARVRHFMTATTASRSSADAAAFWAAARTQARVIGALVLREMRTRFGRTQLGYLTTLIEPVAGIATFSVAATALGHLPPYGTSLPMFFALGMLAYNGFRRVASYCAAAFDANQALLHYPIVKQIDTLIARATIELALSSFACISVLTAITSIFGLPGPVRVEGMIAALVLMVGIGFGWGSLTAVIARGFKSWRNIEPLLTRPMFFMSGVLFVPDRLPPKVLPFLTWNPLLHGVELMRASYYPSYRSTVLNVPYLAGWALVLVVLALAAERAMRVRAERGDGGVA